MEKGVSAESQSLKLGCSLYTLHHQLVNLNDLAAKLLEKAIHLFYSVKTVDVLFQEVLFSLYSAN